MVRIKKLARKTIRRFHILTAIALSVLPGVVLANFEFTIKNGANNPPMEFWTTADHASCFSSPNQALDDLIGTLNGGQGKTINLSVHGHGGCEAYGQVEIKWYAGRKGQDTYVNHIILAYQKYGESVSVRVPGPGELRRIGTLSNSGRQWTFETLAKAVNHDQANGRAEAFWKNVCNKACEVSNSVTVTKGNTTEKVTSREETTSIATSFSVGVDFPYGISAEASTSAESSRTVGQQFSQAVSSERSSTSTKSTTYTPDDFYKFGIESIWQWVAKVPMSSGGYVIVKSNNYTCTSNGDRPTYLPGSSLDVGSCNTEVERELSASEKLRLRKLQLEVEAAERAAQAEIQTYQTSQAHRTPQAAQSSGGYPIRFSEPLGWSKNNNPDYDLAYVDPGNNIMIGVKFSDRNRLASAVGKIVGAIQSTYGALTATDDVETVELDGMPAEYRTFSANANNTSFDVILMTIIAPNNQGVFLSILGTSAAMDTGENEDAINAFVESIRAY